VYRAAFEACSKRGLNVVRSHVGNLCTSLDMAGCSITLTKLDEQLVDLWDAPVHTPALRWGV
jgi:dihydroxyacetone kinase-like protein